MPDIVLPFLVNYDGKDADANMLEASALGESITGASKLYTAVAHYCVFGFVPRGRYRKSFMCYARPAAPGSWDQLWFITPLAGEYGIHAQIYNKAISYIFGRVVGSLKSIWTRPREVTEVIEQLTEDLREEASSDSNVLQVLANGVVKANTDLSSLQSQLIEIIPQLANTTRPYGRNFVRPIGETCSRIVQFQNKPFESSISESDAEVIRGNTAMEVGTMEEFRVTRISEVDIRTGHCVIDVEGIAEQLIGKITDPALEIPENMYTSSLNNHTGFVVQAKAIRKNGEIRRLYISNVL